MKEACRSPSSPSFRPTAFAPSQPTQEPSIKHFNDDVWYGRHDLYDNDDQTRNTYNGLYGS